MKWKLITFGLLITTTCLLGNSSRAMDIGYYPALIRNTRYMLEKHPAYVMSSSITPDAPISEGVDCSRLWYLIFKWSGVPGVQRVTSEQMSRGMGGWVGIDIDFDELDNFDFLYFTFPDQPGRPRGHVGAKFFDKMVHSSASRKGVIADSITAPWIRKCFVVGRKLIIGE